MTVRQVIEYPNPILSRTAARVDTFDAALGRTIDDLVDTLQATPGIGMSAPQIGESVAVFAMLSVDASAPPDVFVNPELVKRSGFCVVEERCLSVPGAKANVFRAPSALIRAQDRDGTSFERELNGMPAVCFQHELDHLEGKVFLDRLSKVRRWFALARRKPEQKHALA